MKTVLWKFLGLSVVLLTVVNPLVIFAQGEGSIPLALPIRQTSLLLGSSQIQPKPASVSAEMRVASNDEDSSLALQPKVKYIKNGADAVAFSLQIKIKGGNPANWSGYALSIINPADQSSILQASVTSNPYDFSIPELGKYCSDRCEFVGNLTNNNQVVASTRIAIPVAEKFSVPITGTEFASKNGKIKVNVHNGALTKKARFYIVEKISSQNSLSGKPFLIDAEYEDDGQNIHEFNEVIDISLAYGPEELQGEETAQTLAYFDETAQTWKYMPTEVDTNQHTLTTYSYHLTVFDRDFTAVDKFKFNDMSAFQASTFTGSGTYSYPINIPSGPGGFTPSLNLTYNSNVPDSTSFYTQGSWVGMGWDLETGAITRNTQGTQGLSDDTFSLSLPGMSGLLLPVRTGTDSALGRNFVEYNLQNEDFTRVRWYQGRTNTPGYDTDDSYWKVFDKTGNIYTFGTSTSAVWPKMFYTRYGTTPITVEVYKWYLSTVANQTGQTFTYVYSKTFVTRSDQSKANGTIKCGNCSNLNDVEVYLDAIYYPSNYYRIRFERQSRPDYILTCFTDHLARCTSDKERLRQILVEYDANAPATWGTTHTTVRGYQFTYTNDAEMNGDADLRVFPGLKWQPTNVAGTRGYTTTLKSVQEFGSGPRQTSDILTLLPLPAVSFVYADRMHLTDIYNGYYGRVHLNYETAPWPGTGFAKPCTACPSNLPIQDFYAYGNWSYRSNFTQTGNWYQLMSNEGFFTPGKVMALSIIYHSTASTSKFNFTFNLGDTSASSGMIVMPNTSGAQKEATYLLYVPAGVTNGGYAGSVAYEGNGIYVDYMAVAPVMTRYRVTSRTVYPHTDTPGVNYTTFYSYSGPAVNTRSLTEPTLTEAEFTNATTLHKPFSEFRGHSLVRITQPDNSYTETNFYQTDRKAGMASSSALYDNTGKKVRETVNSYTIDPRYPTNPTPIQIVAEASANGYQPKYQSSPDLIFVDAKIWWVAMVSSENRIYDSQSPTTYSKTVTQTDYIFGSDSMPVFGLPASVWVYGVDSNNNPITRTKSMTFYKIQNGQDRNLRSTWGVQTNTIYKPGLPEISAVCKSNVPYDYANAYQACGSGTLDNYLSFKWAGYDATLGRLTETYTVLEATGSINNSLANRKMSATKLEYDAYGNVNKTYEGKKEGKTPPIILLHLST